MILKGLACLVVIGTLLILSQGVAYAAVPISDGFDYPVGIPNGDSFQISGWEFLEDEGSVFHPGEDWNFGSGDDDLGLPVYAIANGKVVASDDYGCGWGNIIVIEHKENSSGNSETVWSQYAHLQTRLVTNEEYVHRGEQIGTIGTAYYRPALNEPCNAQFSPHLHFEIRKNDMLANAWVTGQNEAQILANYFNPSDFIDAHRPQITPLIGDWGNNDIDTNGTFDPHTSNFSLDSGEYFIFGDPGDFPLIGDWNNNGIDTIGVYRPKNATFYLDFDNDESADQEITFGEIGDFPIVGDWNNDGTDTIGIYRPGTAEFHLDFDNDQTTDQTVQFEDIGDFPIVGDWDNNGADDIGVFRRNDPDYSNNAVFYLRNIAEPISFGNNDDTPIVGKPYVDGLTRIGVYRPSEEHPFIYKPEPITGNGNLPNNPPNVPSTPDGPISGITNSIFQYSYTTSSTDIDGDVIKYLFDWGDGTTTETTHYPSGSIVSGSHIWTNPGLYQVKAKAIDGSGLASEWSETLSVWIIPPSNPQLLISISANPDHVITGQSSQVTIHVTSGGAQVTGASIEVSTTGGNLDQTIGTTDVNGDFVTTYTAPSVISQIQYSISATATKEEYNTASSSDTITVQPFAPIGDTIRVYRTFTGQIDVLDIETEYLPYVVAAENGADTVSIESMKAQAVASRTFAYYKKENPSGSNFDVYDDESDQVYNPNLALNDNHIKSVSETNGIILKYNNVIIASFYVSGAGSTTQYVTYNEGKSGDDITQSSIGWVTNPPSLNPYNRGCMGQNQANTLADSGHTWQMILRYFYGEDIIIDFIVPTLDPIANAIVVDKNAWVSTSSTGDSQAMHIFNSPVGFLSATDGDTFLILSSGIAENIPGNPDDFESTDLPPGGYSGDTASVTLNFVVPTDTNKLKFDFRFMSEEFPEYVGSSFNDFFSAYLTDSTGTYQISFDTNGEIINVNNNFFDPAITPAGTVFDGTTPKLTTTTDVTSGESISLKFELGDAGDGIYDTAVFLDNIRFESEGDGGTSSKADVSVTQHGPTSVEKGKEMTYTINYYNIEEADADNIVVTDTLPNKAIYVEGSAQGGTYDSATHSVSWNLDSMQKFSGGSLSLSISIPGNDPEVEIGTTLINSVSISTTSEENDIQNNNWQWTTAVTGNSILPPNVDIEPLISNYKGVPKIDLNTPMTFIYHGDSTVYGVDINIHLNDGNPDILETMTNIPGTNNWMFTKTFSPRYGFGTITYTVNHYDETSEIIDYNILIDPSGWIEDKFTGERIEGATVTLKRFDTTLQQFVFVEPSDLGIDPHINPQTSDEYGGYGWFVSPGIYRVEVEKVGYYSEYSDVNIPPAVTDLAIKLEAIYVPDTTPPSTITNLQSTSGITWINWTWTNPQDSDFNHTEIYLDNIFHVNTSAEYFNATALDSGTEYTISTRTVDISGNVNQTWMNDTATTLTVDTEPPVFDSINHYPAVAYVGAVVNVSATVSDDSGVADVMIDGVALSDQDGGIWTGSFVVPEDAAVGDHVMSLTANDAAGNSVETILSCSVVNPVGGIAITSTPKPLMLSSGTSGVMNVKLVSSANFDDIVEVTLDISGFPDAYAADLSWFNRTSVMVQVPAGQTVLVPFDVSIPAGVSGYKVFKDSARSLGLDATSMDTGVVYVT